MPYFLSVFYFICLLVQPGWAQQEWRLIPVESTIKFTSTYDNIAFDGEFSRLTVNLLFDPKPGAEKTAISSSVDVTSLNTNSRDRDEALAEPDWFYFSKFPAATFTSTHIQSADDQQMLVSGVLQIRNIKKEITVPMRWQTVDGNKLRLQGTFELDRRDYDIGAGEWKDDSTIGFMTAVKLSFLFARL